MVQVHEISDETGGTMKPVLDIRAKDPGNGPVDGPSGSRIDTIETIV